MEHRLLGRSGLRVPALSFGTGTFGGQGRMFAAWGATDVAGAKRLVDVCVEAGVTLFDSADNYSMGAAEEILGAALAGRGAEVMVSTKMSLPLGDGPNDAGSSRRRLVAGVDAALRRLGRDHIDLLQMHAFDAFTPVEEVVETLGALVASGKVRYLGASNFAAWELMKSLAAADRAGCPRYVAHQAYYSLIGRDYEWELLPLGLDQGVGALAWSPLGWGRLTGRIGRDRPLPEGSRLRETLADAPPVDDSRLFAVVDALEAVARERGRTVPQVAIAWLLRRPTVVSVIIGARDEAHLRDNLGATGWSLSDEEMTVLDAASATEPPYPQYLTRRNPGFMRLNPAIV